MDTANLDSLFYDMPTTFKDIKHAGKSNEAVTSFHEDALIGDLSTTDLDPCFESVQNIQDLIDREGVLFPELFPSGTIAEGEVSQTHTSVAELQLVEDILPMPSVSSGDLEVTVRGNDNIIVIKPEDLAALGVTLSGDLLPQPESSCQPIVVDEVDLDDTRSSFDEQLFDSISTSESPRSARPYGRRSRNQDKSSNEYRQRRAKNNIAVRKSRDKAKIRQQETEGKVKLLSRENDRLQKKVDLLTKELTVLKGLFTNVGADIPARLAALLK